MTREKIIETVNAHVQYNANQGTWSIDNRFADELLALMEQEKKEQAKEILLEFKNVLGISEYCHYLPNGDGYKVECKINKLSKEYGVEL